ncbi:Hypothetical predicted protein, partial [Paramuricea clavata]
ATLVITLERNLHNFRIFSPPEIKEITQDPPDERVQYSSSWLLRQWKKVYDDDELEERLNEMKNDEEDHEEKLDELRKDIKKTNDVVHENMAATKTKIENTAACMERKIENTAACLETKIENTAAMETAKIENRLKNIEEMLAQIQAGGILHSGN